MAPSETSRYNFHTKNQWNGGGDFLPALRTLKPLGLWIKNYSHEMGNLEDLYVKYMQNDGKLVGQEKGILIRKLNDLAGGLILFRRYITPGNPASFTTRQTTRTFQFTITMNTQAWTGEGTVGYHGTYHTSSFAAWYKDFCGGFRNLLQLYGTCLEDKILTEEESRSLQEATEDLLYQILVIQRQLHFGSITS